MTPRTPREALRIAVAMEEGAVRLYERMLMVLPGDGKAAAEDVLRDEKSHLRRFRALLAACPPEGRPENELLLEAEGEGLLFPGGLIEAAREGMLASPEKLLEAAIRAEDGSTEAYRRFAASVPDGEARAVLASIAEEETAHAAEWRARLTAIRRP